MNKIFIPGVLTAYRNNDGSPCYTIRFFISNVDHLEYLFLTDRTFFWIQQITLNNDHIRWWDLIALTVQKLPQLT